LIPLIDWRMTQITVGLVDDHQLFLKSLSLMLDGFPGFKVVIEALNGKDLQDRLKSATVVPDIMLIDVNMPVLGGAETAEWLHQQYPLMHLVALSMNDADKSIIRMIKAGCCAYLLKDTHPNELEKAMNEIYKKGHYNADLSNINYRRLLLVQEKEGKLQLNEREKEFLQLSCSDFTYKQIAMQMQVSERTVDGYRENLFQKFNVQSRVGLCLEAIRRDLVKI
jgi:DNA-binding NarL/FixJ family response regulator